MGMGVGMGTERMGMGWGWGCKFIPMTIFSRHVVSVRKVGIQNIVEYVETATDNSAAVAVTLPASSSLRTTSGWPEKFVIPQFDHDIKLLLQKGNDEYNRSGQWPVI